MNKLNDLKNQRGVSLVEVLAVIVILSIVGLLLFSIISSGQKQYTEQSAKNQDLKDISYALKVITKEIRQNPSNIHVENDTIQINEKLYKLIENEKVKSIVIEIDEVPDETLVTDIDTFHVEKDNKGNITITIDGVTTNIVIRK